MTGGGTDAELVARVREGDLGAFDRLVARHRARVFAIARQIATDADAAQDIAQEAFLQAFRALDSIRDHERVGPWLNTIVRRQAQRRLREAQRWPASVDLETVRGAPAWRSWPEPEPPGEMVERVRSLLAVLSQRERQVMILHYLEGRSCQEIAVHLRTSVGTIKRILHDSRRKARKEGTAMANQHGEPGPRRLTVWIDGSPSPGRWNVFDHLRPLMAQAVCLAVNKLAKTTRQVAEQIGAHADYVQETVTDLAEMEVLVTPRNGAYATNFIAFDAADWRRLMGLVREPAAKAASALSAAESRLKAAFEKTPLAASGWAWEDVVWAVYGVFVANTGASRNQPEALRPQVPRRVGGGRYWLGGHEQAPGLPIVWTTGFNSGELGSSTVREGYFWTWGMNRERVNRASPAEDRAAAFELFADAPLAEEEALSRLGGDPERWRGAFADLVSARLLTTAHHQYRLAVPFFTQAESDILTPEVDAVTRPVIESVAVPALDEVDASLDEMGYEHRRDQYGQWHRWLTGNIMGEALRFMMEQGVLPRPPDPAPANFAYMAWKGDLPLMSWGVDYGKAP
ncbi:MAG TPA: sigma-70 family RNA polymerase sigma factor [Armatimonadota bacterium]|nr:sigma-70 family RNA polymerase sigma factor [Armatimonadota bacterium]